MIVKVPKRFYLIPWVLIRKTTYNHLTTITSVGVPYYQTDQVSFKFILRHHYLENDRKIIVRSFVEYPLRCILHF
jgi:hypothetical protein